MPKHLRRQIQMDEVSQYSVTDDRTADKITELILKLPGITGASTVTGTSRSRCCSSTADQHACLTGIPYLS